MATALSRNFRHLFLVSRGGRARRNVLLSRRRRRSSATITAADTRSRALGLHQTAVYMGTIGGGFFAGLIAETLRLAAVVRRVRRAGRAARVSCSIGSLIEPARGAAEAASATAAGRRPGATLGLRRASSGWSARTPTLLCLLGAFMCANFVAVVLLSWMPKFLYDRFHMGLAMAGLTATIFVQLASMAGAPVGGWLADWWRRRSPRGRMAVQTIGVLGGAPFVVVCGLTQSVGIAHRRTHAAGDSSRACTTRTSSRRSSTSCRPRRAGGPRAS